MNIRFILPNTDKMNGERDHFLTDTMGACWHEYDPHKPVRFLRFTGYQCKKCGNFFFANNDFSTMEDFMKLLNWANEQGALSPVVSQFETKYFMDEEIGPQSRKRFADVLYGLLATVKRKNSYAQRQRAC
jgi:hypothetical protein